MCARGILLSDISLDFVRTLITSANPGSWARVNENLSDMRTEGTKWLESEKVPLERQRFVQVVEARYEGQNFEVAVNVPATEEMTLKFAKGHRAEYGYDIADRTVEIVNCRIKAVGLVPKPDNDFLPASAGPLEQALIETRSVLFSAKSGRAETPVYVRSKLPLETPFSGPAIVEEMSSTTIIPPGTTSYVDRSGNIIISNLKVMS